MSADTMPTHRAFWPRVGPTMLDWSMVRLTGSEPELMMALRSLASCAV